jgi:hypothetical protein
MMWAVLFLAIRPLAAEEPLPPDTTSAVEGSLSNDILQLRYLWRPPVTPKGDLDLGLLITQKPEFLVTGAYMFNTDFSGVPGLTINVGPQAYAGWLQQTSKTQVFAVAAGVNARYEVVPPWHLGVFLHAFYSPGIVTFGADNVYDFSAGADVRVNDRFTVLAGYRWLKITLENLPDDRIQNSVYAGLRWKIY